MPWQAMLGQPGGYPIEAGERLNNVEDDDGRPLPTRHEEADGAAGTSSSVPA